MKSIRIRTLEDGSYVVTDGELTHLVRLRLGETREVWGMKFINHSGETAIQIDPTTETPTKSS